MKQKSLPRFEEGFAFYRCYNTQLPSSAEELLCALCNVCNLSHLRRECKGEMDWTPKKMFGKTISDDGTQQKQGCFCVFANQYPACDGAIVLDEHAFVPNARYIVRDDDAFIPDKDAVAWNERARAWDDRAVSCLGMRLLLCWTAVISC